MSGDFNNQRGNVLIYAMLTIAAILSTTIVVSNFVHGSIRRTGFLSDAASAFYAGESGMEKALYDIRKQNKLPTDGDCGLDLTCEISVGEDEVNELSLDLNQNQTVQFDLFNPENNLISSHAESMGLTWDDDNGSWLEVSAAEWSVGSSILWKKWTPTTKINELGVQKYLYSGGAATNNFLSAAKNYRIRVKALYGGATNLKIKLFNLDNLQGSAVSFPNYLKIKAVGGSREANQAVSVTMPRFAPTMGLFDYVLFSESTIVK